MTTPFFLQFSWLFTLEREHISLQSTPNQVAQNKNCQQMEDIVIKQQS